MKFCRKCGASLEDKALFCTQCGASFQNDPDNSAEKSTVAGGAEEPASEAASTLTSSPVIPPDKRYTQTPATSYTQVPATGRAVEKKQPSGIGIKLISIFLSIILCVFLLVTCCLDIVRTTLDPDSIADAVTDIDVENVGNYKIEDENGEEVPVKKLILDFCDEEVKEKYNLDEDKVIAVLDDTKADEFLAEVIADYSAYFFKGEELRELNSERIISWIKENEETIENVVEYEFKDADYDYLEKELNNNEIIKSLSESELESGTNSNMSEVSNALSLLMNYIMWVFIIMEVLCIFFAVVIVVINRKKVRALFTYVTVCLAVVGGFYLLVSGSLFIVMSAFLPKLINDILGSLVLGVLLRGGIMFGVGLISSIVYKIIADKRRARA